MTLPLIAAWIWFCLVMCENNRMRIALLGPVLIPLGVIAVFFKWLGDHILKMNKWVASLNFGTKE